MIVCSHCENYNNICLSTIQSEQELVEDSSKDISHHRKICHLHHHLCSRHHLHCLEYYQPISQVSHICLRNVKVTLNTVMSHNQSIVSICVRSSSLCFCQEKTRFILWSYKIGTQITCWGGPGPLDPL